MGGLVGYRDGRRTALVTGALLTLNEDTTRRVWAVPDVEPVVFDKPRCVYASWITPELMRETEEG